MSKHRYFGLLAAFVLLVAAIGSYGGALPTKADTRSELEQKLDRLEEKEKEIKSDLAAASTDLAASQERKELLDNQISNVTQQIETLQEQWNVTNSNIAKKEGEIKQAQTDIAEKEAAIQATHDLLGQRLRTIAKSGNLSAIQRLLNTENYTEYLLKSKAAECIARRDQQTMDELEAALKGIQAQKKQLEQQKKEIEAEKAEIERLKAASDKKKKELDTLHSAAQSEVRKLQSSVSSYNAQLAATQREMEETDAAITRLINSTASSGTYNNSNMMFWPAPSCRIVTSNFGSRWGTWHKGTDIAGGAAYGADIVAAADGTVIFANSSNSWGGGYGYYCIVDHGVNSKGQTVSTLYAHCSRLNVSVGQKVTGGKTVLGKIGNTGNSFGAHLHFEVRINGNPVNALGTYISPHVN